MLTRSKRLTKSRARPCSSPPAVDVTPITKTTSVNTVDITSTRSSNTVDVTTAVTTTTTSTSSTPVKFNDAPVLDTPKRSSRRESTKLRQIANQASTLGTSIEASPNEIGWNCHSPQYKNNLQKAKQAQSTGVLKNIVHAVLPNKQDDAKTNDDLSPAFWNMTVPTTSRSSVNAKEKSKSSKRHHVLGRLDQLINNVRVKKGAAEISSTEEPEKQPSQARRSPPVGTEAFPSENADLLWGDDDDDDYFVKQTQQVEEIHHLVSSGTLSTDTELPAHSTDTSQHSQDYMINELMECDMERYMQEVPESVLSTVQSPPSIKVTTQVDDANQSCFDDSFNNYVAEHFDDDDIICKVSKPPPEETHDPEIGSRETLHEENLNEEMIMTDDNFLQQPDVVSMIEEAEIQYITQRQQLPSESFKCTPEQIEEKRLRALERRKHKPP